MTNEEAIMHLDYRKDFATKAQIEAIDVAIKALEQQPCEDAISREEAIRVASGYCHTANISAELAKLPSVNPKPCGDVISRQDVVKAVDKHTNEDGTLDDDITCILEDVPSVSTEKTGHWIRMKAYEKWGCSECDTVFRFTFKEHNYCPNCGCKMMEGVEE